VHGERSARLLRQEHDLQAPDLLTHLLLQENAMTQNRRTVIWRFLDGRAGHENQVLGLSDAIGRLHESTLVEIPVGKGFRGLNGLMPNRFSFAEQLPAPELLIGAGHSTHIPLLRCQRRFGGKTVVIMKPSLPVSLFDLCLIPRHDRLRFPPRNVERTEGALNRIQPSATLDRTQGLILVGGPSKHFVWSDAQVAHQVCTLAARHPLNWTIASSERTPQSLLQRLRSDCPSVPIVTPHSCSSDWLRQQLTTHGIVWVTCDSMSMIYEAVTAGAEVGLLELQATAHSRLAGSLPYLTQSGLATRYSDWVRGFKLSQPKRPFSEADRCSALVVSRCLKLASKTSPCATVSRFLSGRRTSSNGQNSAAGFDSLLNGCGITLR